MPQLCKDVFFFIWAGWLTFDHGGDQDTGPLLKPLNDSRIERWARVKGSGCLRT